MTSVYPHANTGTCITTNACNFAIGAVLELFIEGQWKLIPHGTSITTRITSPSNRACPAHRLGWFMKRHSVRQETSSPPLPSRTLSRLSQDCVVQCNTGMAAMMSTSPSSGTIVTGFRWRVHDGTSQVILPLDKHFTVDVSGKPSKSQLTIKGPVISYRPRGRRIISGITWFLGEQRGHQS